MRQSMHGKRASFLVGLVLFAVVYSAAAQRSALPQTVVNAHTVFLENETGFPELQYTAILELSKWGHFELAESQDKADLVLRLDSGTRVHLAPEGQTPVGHAENAIEETSVPSGHTRIALLDPKSGQLLWSDVHKTEGGKVKSGHLFDGLREAFRDYEKGKR
jgi:hypothetical protein